MERDGVRASFNGNPSQRPTSIQPKPPSQISLPTKPPISSYLARRINANESELSIFDAERYFNEGRTDITRKISESCDSPTNPRDSSVSSVDGYARNWRSRSFRATPTASSEASWNSQSGLLSNPRGSLAVNVRKFPLNEKRRTGSSSSPSFAASRRFFGRNCLCYGKKSVDVEEKYAEAKSSIRVSSDKASIVSSTVSVDSSLVSKISAGIWATDLAVSTTEKPFPSVIGHRIVNSGRPFVKSAGFSVPIMARPPAAMSGDIDPARNSLEVFRPPDERPSLRRPADSSRRPVPPAGCDDDVASDASSDLFEIDSFSTHSAYRRHNSFEEFPKLTVNAAAGNQQFRRSMEGTATSVAPSECYAPSEVSVDWSVTTAEGGFDPRASLANFSSAASDYDEARFIQTEHDRFGAAMMGGNGEGNKKKSGGGLLSCRCENSVNVGPSPVRIGPDQRRNGNAVLADEPDRRLGMSRFALE